jgi:hypothetical protein
MDTEDMGHGISDYKNYVQSDWTFFNQRTTNILCKQRWEKLIVKVQ